MSDLPKLLLVDDRPENLLALEGLLRRDDAEILKAESGKRALELLLEHEVALALIDVQMPELDGFALAELMRNVERTREIPIIFVTAGLHDRDRVFIYLRSRGETEIIDELRVIITETGGPTAYFTFSSQMRPSLHLFRIYGNKNGLILDHDQETLIKLRGARYKSYAEKFVPPVNFARQYLGNLRTNLRCFLARDFHMKSGMKCLIEAFYQSIVNDGPVPIPYREIVLTAKIMDAIFLQLDQGRSVEARVASPQAASKD